MEGWSGVTTLGGWGANLQLRTEYTSLPSAEIAFQSATHHLDAYAVSGINNNETGLSVESNTSPSIVERAPGDGEYVIAFTAAGTRHLYMYTYKPSNGVESTYETGLGIESGTSPTITSLSGGRYITAFQAGNSKHLYTYTFNPSTGVGQNVETTYTMPERSGPGIAP
jgi:hypothetical protein